MGSASLEQNVLNAKSRVLVFTPFSDTSFYDAGVTVAVQRKVSKMATIIFTNESYLLQD